MYSSLFLVLAVGTTMRATLCRTARSGARRLCSGNAISSEKYAGFEAVLERAAAILHNVSFENQRVTVLHVHASGPGKGLALLRSRHMDMDACAERGAEGDVLADQYESVETADMAQPLPYGNQAYALVASLLPPSHTGPMQPPLEEVLRVLKEDGFALIGCSASVWRDDAMVEKLLHLKGGTFLSAIDLNCSKEPMKEPYFLTVVTKKRIAN